MSRSICKNCKHCLKHPKGKVCDKYHVFVQEDNYYYCDSFKSEEKSDPTKLVLFAVAVVGIVIFLLKIL